jgi:hypothetical protein
LWNNRKVVSRPRPTKTPKPISLAAPEKRGLSDSCGVFGYAKKSRFFFKSLVISDERV